MLNYHTHSEKSFLDGFGTAEDFAKQAVELEQTALGFMEHGSMLSALDLQRACDKYSIKPVFGCEFYFVSDTQIKDRSNKNLHMGIIAKNDQGFKDMQSLCTYANMKGFYYRPRIDIYALLNIDLRNVIISTVCPGSFINNPDIDKITQKLLENHADIFVEVQPHKNKIHKDFNEKAYEYACKWNLDLIAGVDAHCARQEDVYTQDILMAVQMRKVLSDPTLRLLPRSEGEDFHTYRLWGKQEFLQMDSGSIPYSEIESAIENTNWVADKCNVKIDNKKIILPLPPKLKEINQPDEDILWNLCLEGFKKRLNINIEDAEQDSSYFMGFPEEEIRYEKYLERFNEEFDLFASKGYCIYFLICDDVIKWCRKNDIPVGPGRGSSAGSLIAFLLNITHLDPIENNLIFARFLNEERGDFPDIDMDFGQKERKQVIKYITEEYGSDHTGFIVTFSKMKTKAAVRDISRAFGVSLVDVNNFAKTCVSYDDKDDLEEGLDSGYGRIFLAKYPKVIEFIKKARGTTRGTSVHASGIIVNKASLSDGSQCTILRDKGSSNKRICGVVMDDCENSGLMKLDILGLATLDVLHHCRKVSGIEWESIPMDDPKVFESISAGKTLGAFQIEAMASTKIVKQIKPQNFDEVVACIALVRPGPFESGMTDLYIERKNGAEWESMHPFYEEITKNTYGILCYQESVMECFVKLAGMPFSKADKIRKIIGKKRDEAAFEPYWKEFRQGCLDNNTLSEDEAEVFWEGLLKWASYGFNLSHSASYALITYWCMWYKINHPEIFYCAALSFASWDEKKADISKSRLTMMEEILIKNPEYRIMTPKYDLSEGRVWTFKNNTFYMPFDCINSVEKKADEYAKKKKKKSSMISIFDDIDVAMIEADSKQDELLVEMMCHDPERLPTLENQKKHLPFQLPYQPDVEIINKKSVANNCQKDILQSKQSSHRTQQAKPHLRNKRSKRKR